MRKRLVLVPLVVPCCRRLPVIARRPGHSARSHLGPELAINRFIISAERGSKVIALSLPTFPKKLSPKIKLILALSIVLGGMIGVVFVLVNNTIRKRKEIASKV